MDERPRCFGGYNADANICETCHVRLGCRKSGDTGKLRQPTAVRLADETEGELEVEGFHLGYTLGSGQVFRWGRDVDGWWKGIAYGTAFHLKQAGSRIRYHASAAQVSTYSGAMETEAFLRWYLRLDEPPKVVVPRGDTHLRKARDLLKEMRFVRQEPAECVPSYVLSVQARMALTKQRLNFLARILGERLDFKGECYYTFPTPEALGDLSEVFLRRHRFGWRSPWVVQSARFMEERLASLADAGLEEWRAIVDTLRTVRRSGLGLKVAKCIDLFSLERLNAVPVDTWVKKFCSEWYDLEGSDKKLCEWAEARGGRWAGYMNEYLFIYYREVMSTTLSDRIITFCESEEASPELPMEDRAG